MNRAQRHERPALIMDRAQGTSGLRSFSIARNGTNGLRSFSIARNGTNGLRAR